MLESEEIDGLRIDHIDGLFDPKAYLDGLRSGVRRPFYLVVEKILAPHESLRADWPSRARPATTTPTLRLACWWTPAASPPSRRPILIFAGEDQDFATGGADGKLRIMENEMASELNALGRRAAQLAGESDDR